MRLSSLAAASLVSGTSSWLSNQAGDSTTALGSQDRDGTTTASLNPPDSLSAVDLSVASVPQIPLGLGQSKAVADKSVEPSQLEIGETVTINNGVTCVVEEYTEEAARLFEESKKAHADEPESQRARLDWSCPSLWRFGMVVKDVAFIGALYYFHVVRRAQDIERELLLRQIEKVNAPLTNEG